MSSTERFASQQGEKKSTTLRDPLEMVLDFGSFQLTVAYPAFLIAGEAVGSRAGKQA